MARNGRYTDLTGKTFGLLKVLGRDMGKTDISRSCFWICECQCKNKTIVSRKTSTLKSGNMSNCGCLNKERLIKQSNNMKKHGKTNDPLFHIWTGMRYRCYSSKSPVFPYYGGRGIRICDEWKDDFMSFYNWAVSSGYEKGLTIDRIDYDGDYCPDNCRWVTNEQQQQNKSNVPLYEYRGKLFTTGQFEKFLNGPKRGYVLYRVKRGMTLEQIASELEEQREIEEKYIPLKKYAEENGITVVSAKWRVKTGKLVVRNWKGHYYVRKE